MAEVKEFYTVRELADMLAVNEMTVRRMMRRGELPYHNIGRAKRFRRDDVEAFLKRCRVNRREDNNGTEPS